MARSARMERPTSGDGDCVERSLAAASSAHDSNVERRPARETAAFPEQSGGSDLEHDLIRRAQGGEEAAFQALVLANQQRAFRIARNMVPSDEDARDLTQDAFLRVFKSLDRFDFQFSFATWLHRIVTNLAIDHLRKRRLIATTSASGDDEEGEIEIVDHDQPQPSRRLEALETAQRVRACIAALAPHFQAVLTLRELEGMPCTEIAKIVGATHVTVRWRLHRGRKLFQEEWERRERARLSGAAGGGPADATPDAANRQGSLSVDDLTGVDDLSLNQDIQ